MPRRYRGRRRRGRGCHALDRRRLHRTGRRVDKDRTGAISHRARGEIFDGKLTAVDFGYIDAIFPDFRGYLDGDIGVHTKRGCPFQCNFCLYNQIEGHRQRYRNPSEVAKEVETLNKQYGVKRISFTDAQFCSTRKSTEHVEQILDEMLARKTQSPGSAIFA